MTKTPINLKVLEPTLMVILMIYMNIKSHNQKYPRLQKSSYHVH